MCFQFYRMVPSNATTLIASFAADFINQGKTYTGISYQNVKCPIHIQYIVDI